jgi:hypothetical protein
MKTIKIRISPTQIASALLLSGAIALPVMPSYAQNVAGDPTVVQQAQDLCVQQAQSKGFELKEVVYAGGADKAGKDAKIVLNLLKEGQLFKLTCYYDKASGQADFGEDFAKTLLGDDASASTTPSIPWWSLLLPLLGLGLLLAWARNRDRALGIVDNTYNNLYEADIRTHAGEPPVNVYAHPSENARIIGLIHNGARVKITNHDTDSWIELAKGGWVPKQYVGTPSRG